MNNSPAPVILFTYKRLENVKKIVKSLSDCVLAKESDVVVFSDAPKSAEDENKVKAVRKYLRALKHFKSIEIIERKENLGVDYNIIRGIQEASQKFDRFIVLEDDLVLGNNFLLFMNQALNYYSKHPEVLSISGYSYVNKFPENYEHDVYFTKRSWSWGWATWSDKIKSVDWDVIDFESFEANKALQRNFNRSGGSDLSKMLKETMKGKIRAWDIRLFYYQFKHNLVTAYPTSSKVINVGFNKDGSNTFGYNRYKTELDTSDQEIFKLCEPVIHNKINSEFLKRNNLKNRIATRLYSMLGLR